MSQWFHTVIVVPGQVPLFCFLVAFIVGFLGARVTTRLIRAGARYFPGNVHVGGLHIHHVVPGVILMVLGSVTGLAIPPEHTGSHAVAAAVLGLGTALVLDEFALILRLRDVYWSAEGRASVNAVFMLMALTGLLILGVRPGFIEEVVESMADGTGERWAIGITVIVVNLTLAVITVLKGKIVTGIVGLYIPFLLWVAAIRLARPTSPWARWRYHRPGDRAAGKLRRSIRRERYRTPLTSTGRRLSELIAGRPDDPHAEPELEPAERT